jgi:hypothetical protein
VRHKEHVPLTPEEHVRLTPQELARLADQFAVSALGNRLGRDPAFLAAAARVRAGEDAWKLARPYISKGSGRHLIARLLEIAADPTDTRPVVDCLINRGQEAFWADTPTAPGDALRWLRKDAITKLQRGAELLARRGAGSCLGCDTPLTATCSRTPHGRWQRIEYCGPCQTDKPARVREGPDRHAIKAVLDGALPLILHEQPNRPATRRSKRKSASLPPRPAPTIKPSNG